MTPAARRAAVEIVAAFGPLGRRLGPEHVAEIAGAIARHYAADDAPEEDCPICETRPAPEDDGPSVSVGGVLYCASCAHALARARRLDGRVLRYRCCGVVAPGCGRIYRVLAVGGRGETVVEESSGVCHECRPAQERAIEALGGDARGTA